MTNKREPENYIDPELINAEYSKDIKYTDTCDAKKIIGSSLRISKDDVLDKIWPKMKYENMSKMVMKDGIGEFEDWLKAFMS